VGSNSLRLEACYLHANTALGATHNPRFSVVEGKQFRIKPSVENSAYTEAGNATAELLHATIVAGV
jgi:hypothetical protein